ncbi:MAG: RDD family protein [Alphaproteobacteria bacterium]
MSDTNSSTAGQAAYARFLPRLRALILDSIILVVVLFAAMIVAVAIRSDNFVRPLGFAVMAFWLVYEPLLVAYAGGTLGHRWSNLRVVDDRTQGNVGLLQAIGRAVIKGVLGWLSFVTMLTTRRSQAVHDLITRSTVQIRDLSIAGPKLFVRERTEFANPLLPSWQRRTIVILVYMVIVSVLCFVIFGVLLHYGLFSDRCIDRNRCTRTEEITFNALGAVWVIGCIVMLVLGWRGKLYGARKG